MLDTFKRFVASYGYDATDDRGRRKPAPSTTYAEDEHADRRKRTILSASARDMARNFAIAAWAIRKHLDYVSDFTFQAKTDDAGFNVELESYMASAMRPMRFDAAQRHNFRRAVRIAEACAVKDGDINWLKIAPPAPSFLRGTVQAIEGDRIQIPQSDIPENSDKESWVNGVRIGPNGESAAYAICKRDGSQMKLERIVSARSMITRGFYDRYDQVRGISPIASGLNWFKDTYEGFEYSIAKLKVGQLFGLQVFRNADDALMGAGTAYAETDADGDGQADAGYAVDFNRGPFMLDMEPGDKAEILESRTPSTETVDFLKLMVHVALKALDIPYSFFDESFTNFYGSRGGLIQYLKSCTSKIADLQEFQDSWAIWRLGLAVADGDVTLPSGRDFNWLNWEFVPAGVPWWDPVKEVNGNRLAVASGFTSPQRVCREVGTDFETNIRERAEAERIATDAGVTLDFGIVAPQQVEVTNADE